MHVLNMLNTRYFIERGTDGNPVAHRNPDALGNAWFIKYIQWVPNADAEMKALDNINEKDTVVIDERFRNMITGMPVYDPSASIRLLSNDLNAI